MSAVHEITRYDVCSLASSAYTQSMTPANIQAAFKAAGIYPLRPDIVTEDKVAPAQVYKSQSKTDTDKISEEDPVHPSSTSYSQLSPATSFLASKVAEFYAASEVKKPRRSKLLIVGGRAIIEEITYQRPVEYHAVPPAKKSESTSAITSTQTGVHKSPDTIASQSQREQDDQMSEQEPGRQENTKKSKGCGASVKKTPIKKAPEESGKEKKVARRLLPAFLVAEKSPKPGPSAYHMSDSSSDDDVEEDREEDLCCVC